MSACERDGWPSSESRVVGPSRRGPPARGHRRVHRGRTYPCELAGSGRESSTGPRSGSSTSRVSGGPGVLRWCKHHYWSPAYLVRAGVLDPRGPSITETRLSVTDRAGRWVTLQVGRNGWAVNEVAAELHETAGGAGHRTQTRQTPPLETCVEGPEDENTQERTSTHRPRMGSSDGHAAAATWPPPGRISRPPTVTPRCDPAAHASHHGGGAGPNQH